MFICAPSDGDRARPLLESISMPPQSQVLRLNFFLNCKIAAMH